MRAEIAISAQK